MTCTFCVEGHPLVRMRGGRQYVHYVNWKVIVCPRSSTVERGPEEARVAGSTPALDTNSRGYSSAGRAT